MKKRFEVRRSFTRPIEVISSIWDVPLEFYTEDLSPRGAFIQSQLMPDMGEHVVCSFDLGKGTQFDFFGEVVRTNFMRRLSDTRSPGFGVHFLDAGPLERLKIREALRGTPPPLPMMRKAPKKGTRISVIPSPQEPRPQRK